MERYKKSEDRNQLSIMPMCLDDMIPEDAEVRSLEVIIDKMDVRSLGCTYFETKQTGRKPYDPADMLSSILTAILTVYVHHERLNANATEILN